MPIMGYLRDLLPAAAVVRRTAIAAPAVVRRATIAIPAVARRATIAGCVTALAAAATATAAPTWLPKSSLPLDSGHEAHAVQVAMDGAGDALTLFNVTSTGVTNAQSVFTVDRPAGGSFGNFTDMAGGPIPADSFGSFDGRLAVDDAGDAASLWSYATPTSGHPLASTIRIRTRRAGGAWSAPTDLSAAGDASTSPTVALAGDGTPTVAWAGGVNGNQPEALTRLADGSWPQPQPLITLDSADQVGRDPTVGSNAAGDRAVAWIGYGSAGGDMDDRMEVNMAPAGSAFGRAQALPNLVTGLGNDASLTRPAVGVDQAGTATIAWGEGIGSPDLAIDVATVPQHGAPSTLKVSGTDQPQTDITPGFAMDARGDAVVMWATNHQIRASFRPAGGAFGAPQTVWSQTSDFSLTGISAAMDPHGDVLATWSVDSAAHSVFVAGHPAGGNWTAPIGVPSDASDPVPSVAIDGAGDGIVAWSPQFGDASSHSVEVDGFDAAGPALHSVSIPGAGVAGSPVAFSGVPLDVWSGLTPATWSFGDGGRATGSAVSHTYAAAGTYTVTLTSTDAVGNTSTTARTISVAPAPPPFVVTGGSLAVGMTSATITATVNPLGQPTSFQFQWGKSTAYGAVAPSASVAVGSDSAPHVVQMQLTHLTPRTTYHYRITATYCGGCAFGSSLGADASFTTATPPPLPANLAWTDSVHGASTVLRHVMLHVVRGAGGVTVTCRGRGCPAEQWHAKTTATTKHCRHRRCTRQVTVLHNIALTGRLAHHALHSGDVVTVLVTKPGYASKVLTITIRKGHEPSFQAGCTLPGTNARFSC